MPGAKTTIRFISIAIVLTGLALLVAECDEVPDSSPPPASRPVVPAGNSSVTGIVRFSAPRPLMKVIGGDCCLGSPPVRDESVLVNDNTTLRNVVVYVKNGPAVPSLPENIGPIIIDQKNCRYSPHVSAARTGEPVDITSHDPTLHNVHVLATANRPQNFSETAVGESHRLNFLLPEFVQFKCDVHPWMSAYLAIFDHPFFTVTGADGSFQIARLPAGSYTLVAWHEKYGMIEAPFTVTETGRAEVNFDYKGP